MSRLTSLAGCLAAALCCAALTSCSDVERMELSDATLEGTITYKGQPVPYALVVATNDKGAASANAANDGTYKLEHVPLGEVKIGVNTDAGQGAMMSDVMAAQQTKTQKPGAKFVAIPKKFFEPSTSGITTTIADGPNQFDIKIE